jgi:hypothetical protein
MKSDRYTVVVPTVQKRKMSIESFGAKLKSPVDGEGITKSALLIVARKNKKSEFRPDRAATLFPSRNKELKDR